MISSKRKETESSSASQCSVIIEVNQLRAGHMQTVVLKGNFETKIETLLCVQMQQL